MRDHEPIPEEAEDRSNWERVGWQSFDKTPFLVALKDKGKPIEVRGDEFYYSKERKEEIETLIKLLSLSPGVQLYDSANSATPIGGLPLTKLAYEAIRRTPSSDQARMLFDPSFQESNSRRPLLYSPLQISDDFRKRLHASINNSDKEHEDDMATLLRSAQIGGKSSEAEVQTDKKKPAGFLRRSIGRLLNRTKPLTPVDKKELINTAYDDLVNRLGYEYLSTHTLPHLGGGELTIPNDYQNPYLLLAEELEERGFDIRLFRVPSLDKESTDARDGLKDGFVTLLDKKTDDIFGELYHGKPMSILVAMYDARGIFYSDYLRKKSEWRNSGFSDEERKRLIGLGRQRELERAQKIQRSDENDMQKKWSRENEERLKQQISDLGESPADQILLRGLIARMVDKELAKKTERRTKFQSK